MVVMTPKVVDLSHWDTVLDFRKVKAAGIVGVIHKATQGTTYKDRFYSGRRKEAVAAGLLWGAYHFANDQSVDKQVENFIEVAAPDGDTLLCLDWEPYGNHTMSTSQAVAFFKAVYTETGQRPVIYSGNLIKEQLNGRGAVTVNFFGMHRLWLAQYGPRAKLPAGFDKYFLWQYTGDGIGPLPHSVDGVNNGGIDLSVFQGTDDELAEQWAPTREVVVG